MPDQLEPRHLEQLPLFPLRGVVLLPHTLLPLQIFEPRYHQMTAWCMGNDWPLAIALLPPGLEASGDPATAAIAGVGDIAHHEHVSAGRHRILVRGLGRVRVVAEVGKVGLIRMVRAEPIADVPAPRSPEVASHLASIRALVRSLSARHPEAAEALDEVLRETDDLAVMVDCVGSVLYREPDDRQTFLEEPRVARRLARVVDDLAALVGEGESGGWG